MSSISPAQNRVTPWGDIVSSPLRGAWMGNRGRLHDESGARLVVRQHQTHSWITCVLSFKDRHAPQWDPHHYTPLFFLDEAVALAAGHRPCAECRRADFLAYQDPAVVCGDHLALWDAASCRYGEWLSRPVVGHAAALTPPLTVRILDAGYVAQIDDAARV